MSDIRYEPQPGFLRRFVDRVALHYRCKAALGGERQLLTWKVTARLFNAGDDPIGRFEGILLG